MKFIQLAGSLKENIAPVYLAEGEEAYFRDHTVAQVRDACALRMPALNDVRYEGETLKGDRLAAFGAELRTAPFLDGRRLVRVYEWYPTEREWESALAPYLAAPCPTTALVVSNAGKKGAFDWKRRAGVTFVDCGRESEETLCRWLLGVARKLGMTLDGDAAPLFVRYCNRDAARLRLEAEKLQRLLGEGGRITRAAVEENVAKDTEYKVYELTQAASRGNHAAFCEILHDLTEKGFDETAALSALVSHYRSLLEVSQMRGSDAEVAKALGVKPYAVQKNREAAARLGKDKVRRLYLDLYGLGADVRGGNLSKSGALSAAIAKIFFG